MIHRPPTLVPAGNRSGHEQVPKCIPQTLSSSEKRVSRQLRHRPIRNAEEKYCMWLSQHRGVYRRSGGLTQQFMSFKNGNAQETVVSTNDTEVCHLGVLCVGGRHRHNLGGGGHKCPPQYFCYLRTVFFWGGGLKSWRGANKKLEEGGGKGDCILRTGQTNLPVFLTWLLDLTPNTHGRPCPPSPILLAKLHLWC